MDLHVTLGGSGDRSARIYAEVRRAILDGRLSPGDRIPPTRELAARLSVARGTVTTAYDRLAAEGFIASRAGSGTFVSAEAAATAPESRRARGGRVEPLPLWRARTPKKATTVPYAPSADLPAGRPAEGSAGVPAGGTAGPTAYDLSVGVPDPSLFPLATWRRLVSAELRPARLSATTYAGPGHPGLQREVARYAGLSRSVQAAGEDVVLTTGAQQALDLVARVVLAPGDVVAVEDPGYTAAHRLFETHRAQVAGVPVDSEGLVVGALPPRARLVYVTPSHQFPTGVAMSLARRTALLQWAVRHDALIVEDDYDSEFRFCDRPLEPLQSLDRDGRVVYVGSFSKTLLPLLRVGYAIAPESLQAALREAKRVTDWDSDAVTQGALARFMGEGLLGAHVRRATAVYRERRETLLEGLAGQLRRHLEVVPSAAGLHVCTRLLDPAALDTAIVARAAERGVLVEALSPRFTGRPSQQGLVLGFGAISAEQIPQALAVLGSAI